MALCGSQNCGCAIQGDGETITITGSGESGDPYVLSGFPSPAPEMQVYGADSTWLKPDGLLYVIVEAVGGGGGAGGAAATAAGQHSFGGGGGAGGYVRKVIPAADLGASETVTIGLGGAGGSGGVGGTAGGTTSFGAHCSATGGGGGFVRGVHTVVTFFDTGGSGALGGIGSAADPAIYFRGEPGLMGVSDPASSFAHHGGAGGSSMFGAGGRAPVSGTGEAGGRGAGGGGVSNTVSAASKTGGAGGDGLVVVTEFFG